MLKIHFFKFFWFKRSICKIMAQYYFRFRDLLANIAAKYTNSFSDCEVHKS